ncbi:MAG: sigma 54-interacting transcriptional regulator [Burkholderiales bacterium]|jgi:two-component system response regulator GlrR|nr:sigma 54-interacting transcriptional regulator [Burkholderiales bacterium]
MISDILLVDDDTDLLKLISLRLSSAGYQVRVSETAECALSMAEIKTPSLVITDLKMPGMNGMQFFEILQQRHPTLPVIILTAHGTIPEAVTATERGVFGFLTKPFDSQELLGKVEAGMRLSAGVSAMTNGRMGKEWRHDIITCAPQMEDLLRQAHLVADTNANVLICGEPGTGKELLARAIYRASRRSNQPFAIINCGAYPDELLETELFGRINDTVKEHGLFQEADGGTLFLDEIGDMPLPLQVKLLRTIQEGVIRPVGSTETIPVDVRIISATYHKLRDLVKANKFREDLFYQLNVVTLHLPKLTDRREDIPLLVRHFLKQLAEQYGRSTPSLASEAMDILTAASWPYNIRQLLNVIEQAFALSTTQVIPAILIQKALDEETEAMPTFFEARRTFERDYLIRLLKMTGGNVTRAAVRANRNRTEFYKLLRRHNLDLALFKNQSRARHS